VFLNNKPKFTKHLSVEDANIYLQKVLESKPGQYVDPIIARMTLEYVWRIPSEFICGKYN
jgi:hypothetical protein